MKNKILIYPILILGFVMILSSCKDDDDSISLKYLTGTVWMSDDEEYCIGFISNASVKFIWYDSWGFSDIENGIYTINKDNIIFDFGGNDYIMNGIIEGNKITCIWYGNVFVLKKRDDMTLDDINELIE